MEKRTLTAEEILSSVDAQYCEIDCPEWGGAVRLRSLSAEEALHFAETAKKDEKNGAAMLVVMSAVDDQGKQLFTFENITAIRRKSMRVINRLQTAALKLNGLDDVSKAQDAAKND